jgi:hypothetical protein
MSPFSCIKFETAATEINVRQKSTIISLVFGDGGTGDGIPKTPSLLYVGTFAWLAVRVKKKVGLMQSIFARMSDTVNTE